MFKSVTNVGAGFVDMNKLSRVLVYHPRFPLVSQCSAEPKEHPSSANRDTPPEAAAASAHYESTSANLSEPDSHLGLKTQTSTDTLLTSEFLT